MLTLGRMAMHEQLRWYAECLPLLRATAVDVGASIGEVSAFFWSAVGEGGRVVSVEPLASNVRRLRERIAEHGARNWRVEACAISDRDGEVALVTAKEGDVWSSVVAAHGTVRVPARRLAAVCPDATIVKLDIEGHEHVVLDDALSALPDVQAWAIELHMIPGRPLQGVLGLLRAHGLEPRIAGRTRSDPRGPWRAIAVPSTLDWSAIPAMPRVGGGEVVPGLKTIHVIGRRGW